MSTTVQPKAPQDRKPKSQDIHDEKLAQADLLVDLPTLKPPHRLRLRQRNKLMGILLDSGLLDDTDENGDVDVDLSTEEGRSKVKNLMATAAAVDDFAESIADNPEEYELWAEGKQIDHFMAILGVYMSAAGESDGSTS